MGDACGLRTRCRVKLLSMLPVDKAHGQAIHFGAVEVAVEERLHAHDSFSLHLLDFPETFGEIHSAECAWGRNCVCPTFQIAQNYFTNVVHNDHLFGYAVTSHIHRVKENCFSVVMISNLGVFVKSFFHCMDKYPNERAVRSS